MVPVPPLHKIGEVTIAEVIEMAFGSVKSIVPVTGPQLLLSLTLQFKLVAAVIFVNTPGLFIPNTKCTGIAK